MILTEKFVRFQDTKYHEHERKRFNDVFSQFTYLKANDPEYRTKIIEARQTYDLMELYRESFWWRPGNYTLRFNIRSPDRAKLRCANYHCEMKQNDVDALRENIDRMRVHHKNLVMSDVEGFVQTPVIWTWRYFVLAPDS